MRVFISLVEHVVLSFSNDEGVPRICGVVMAVSANGFWSAEETYSLRVS